MPAKFITITTAYITLGQLLKLADFISSGGMAKPFLAEETVIINGVQDQRRGRKLYAGDIVEVKGYGRCEVRGKAGEEERP